jgi:hypothetical protein
MAWISSCGTQNKSAKKKKKKIAFWHIDQSASRIKIRRTNGACAGLFEYLDQWEGGNGAEAFCRQPRAFARTDNLEGEFVHGPKPHPCGEGRYCDDLTSAAFLKNNWWYVHPA